MGRIRKPSGKVSGAITYLQWLPHGKPLPDGWRLSSKSNGSHDRFAVLIEKLPLRPEIRKKRRNEEDTLQIASAKFLRAVLDPSVLAWHTPNGGKRSKREAARFKAMGVLAGVADWTLIWPTPSRADPLGHTVGFIELKAKKGRMSEGQESFQARAKAIGARHALCRSLDEIEEKLTAWGVPMRGKIGA